MNIWLVVSEDEVNEALEANNPDPSVIMNREFSRTLEVHVCDKPPYSYDRGIIQVPLRDLLLTALSYRR